MGEARLKASGEARLKASGAVAETAPPLARMMMGVRGTGHMAKAIIADYVSLRSADKFVLTAEQAYAANTAAYEDMTVLPRLAAMTGLQGYRAMWFEYEPIHRMSWYAERGIPQKARGDSPERTGILVRRDGRDRLLVRHCYLMQRCSEKGMRIGFNGWDIHFNLNGMRRGRQEYEATTMPRNTEIPDPVVTDEESAAERQVLRTMAFTRNAGGRAMFEILEKREMDGLEKQKAAMKCDAKDEAFYTLGILAVHPATAKVLG